MIYFLIYLFLEVVVSVKIASAIGGIWTFVELIASALAGLAILRGTLAENIRALNQARIDPLEFQQLNLFTVLGGLLLIVPGFLTDILGILLQFSVITKMLVNRFVAQSKHDSPPHFTQKDDHVIDVEIVGDDADKH